MLFFTDNSSFVMLLWPTRSLLLFVSTSMHVTCLTFCHCFTPLFFSFMYHACIFIIVCTYFVLVAYINWAKIAVEFLSSMRCYQNPF